MGRPGKAGADNRGPNHQGPQGNARSFDQLAAKPTQQAHDAEQDWAEDQCYKAQQVFSWYASTGKDRH